MAGAGFFLLLLVIGGVAVGLWYYKYQLAMKAADELGMDQTTASNLAFLDADSAASSFTAAAAVKRQTQNPQVTPWEREHGELGDKLRQLDDAKAAGLLNDAEYAQAKQRIIDRM
jgi:hypothetical protein